VNAVELNVPNRTKCVTKSLVIVTPKTYTINLYRWDAVSRADHALGPMAWRPIISTRVNQRVIESTIMPVLLVNGCDPVLPPFIWRT